MPIFMLKNHYGMVLVGAESQKEALEMIKKHEDHEHDGTRVSLGVPAQNLKIVLPETKGVLAYYRND